MSEQNTDVNDLIKQMAYIKLLNDVDFKNADKAKREEMKVNREGEITELVNQLSKDIKKFIPDGTNLPISVEFAVAMQMFNLIDRNPEVPINQINVDNKTIFKALNLEIVYDEDRIDLREVAVVAAGGILSGKDGEQNEINSIPKEIPEAREKLFENLSSQVHKEGASIADQSAMVGFSYGKEMDTTVELGLQLSDLQFSDQCEIVKIINDYLRYGDKESADFYCQSYGITAFDLENPKYKHFEHLMDTVSEEEDKVMYEINKLVGPIRILLDYSDKVSPELFEKVFERLKKEIDASEYPVDAIFKAIASSNGLSKNKENYSKFLELGIKKFDDPEVKVDMDGWLLSYMADAVKRLDEVDMRESAESIVEVINRGLDSKNKTLGYDELLELDTLSFQEFISDESRRNQSASECIKSYIKEKGLDYRADRTVVLDTASDTTKQSDREPRLTETREKKREALEKMMNKVASGNGIKRAQEVIEELIARHSDKELAIDAALSFLETQKENNPQFMSADSREAREGVFESIVLTGIEDSKFYERMQELDRSTSKIVVNKILAQINDSRTSINKVLGAVQLLGKNLNERTETTVGDKPLGFLNPDTTILPSAQLLPEDNSEERDEL